MKEFHPRYEKASGILCALNRFVQILHNLCMPVEPFWVSKDGNARVCTLQIPGMEESLSLLWYDDGEFVSLRKIAEDLAVRHWRRKQASWPNKKEKVKPVHMFPGISRRVWRKKIGAFARESENSSKDASGGKKDSRKEKTRADLLS